MRDTERRPWSLGDIGIRLLILVLASLVLMALQTTGRLEPVQSAVTQLTSPAQLGATGLAESITGAISFILELRNLRQRNAELEQVTNSLLVENFELREVQRENQALREMLRFAQTRPGLELRGAQIVARVIGQESNNFLEYITLDLGQSHGIKVGMPVVTDQGLVGRISHVTDSTSKVLLITDANSAVNAIMQSSRLNGVVRGNPGGNLIMDYIPQGAIFSIGEVVLTSGLGGRFPKGIPIGQVVEIHQRDIDVFQQAVVRPTVDFSRLELVMVVTNFDPNEDVPELLAPEISAGGGRELEEEALPAAEETGAGEGADAPVEGEAGTEEAPEAGATEDAP
ncbi:MAG TPA: rod shape-determining protein MreC [Caldilineaceae bacterium]|nr:rod shape-determining protein MreC [Caldilineaceae bacterium]